MTDDSLSKKFFAALSQANDEGPESLLNISISKREFEQAASSQHGTRPQARGRGRGARGGGRARAGYHGQSRYVADRGSERLEHSRMKFGSNTSLASDGSVASSSYGGPAKKHQADRRANEGLGWRSQWIAGYHNKEERSESAGYHSRSSSSHSRDTTSYVKDRDSNDHYSSRGRGNARSKFGSNSGLSSELFASSAHANSHQPDRQQSGDNRWRENGAARENRVPYWKRMDEEPSSSGEFVKRVMRNRDGASGSEGASDNRDYGGRRNGRDRVRHFGYKYLAQLSVKEDHEIIVEMTDVKSPFDEYLKNDQLKPDWLFLMLNIIRKVCQSEFKGNRSAVLDKLCKSKFLSIVSTCLGDVSTEENAQTKQNLPTFIGDLAEFYSCLLNTLPSLALEKDLKRLIMKTRIAVDNVENYLKVKVDEATKQKLQMLDDKYNDYMALITERLPKEKPQTFLERIAECAPPENFRELSLYPTYEDIARQRLGFVRPNIIKGAYDSVEHYLDIQFRLLREDFIDPLRTGLRKYLESRSEPRGRSKFKYDNVRLYPGTRFENVENTKTHQVGILLNFDPDQKMKKFMWERSKRFMHGSLLVFTTDDFQTFFYGTVLERDLTLLKSGKVLISLTEGAKTDKNFFNTPFLMAESEVFFEPYYLIMKLLRDLNEDTFPMKRYIVDGKPDVERPLYLYTLPTMKIGNRTCDSLNTYLWPTADELGLDAFQSTAYKAALTRSFCVIQGPPGTGKTFLGLKIVETIWRNALDYQKQIDAAAIPRGSNPNALKLPILIVCYTNHALDQFLEGMLKFTQKMVRVGGQSRSEVLKNYNLRGRNNLTQLRSKYNFSETMSNVRKTIKTCREEIDRINQVKKSVGLPVGILRLSVLNKVMNENYAKVFKDSDDDFQMWLLAVEENDNQPEFDVENFKDGSRPAGEEEAEEQPMDVDDENDDDEEDTNIVNEDEIFDLEEVGGGNQLGNTRHYSMTVDELGSLCQRKIDERNSLKQSERSFLRSGGDYSEYHNTMHQLQFDILFLINQYQELKKRLESPNFDAQRAKVLLQQHPQMLSPNSRWILYWYWVSQLRQTYAKRLEELEAQHRNQMIRYEEYKQLEDLHVVKQADVVGMTTTGAARLNLLLKSLHPTVVVVEEAAEVLEAHIVASLTHRCQHVILIGDHEQLKPSTAVYELSRRYNINVSLFERMIKNGMDCPMLNVQHRMRPEISCLITPLIYPTLRNHESVFLFEAIKGVKKNVFFIDHKEYEQVLDENQTKQNVHEAQFMMSLARYLVQNGYSPENITVLTTYTGQMFLLRQLKKDNFLLNYLKCVVVDKYQGEENDIILLSLVRSNVDNKIGFLNIKNRVCVALSRAKKGLYIVGNMDCLTKSSELWVSIRKTLDENKAIGNALELYCSKHDETTMVASAKDFDMVKEGGCNRYCNELMGCGHLCPSLCHVMNQDHEEIKCREPCKNTCPRNHPCRLFCYEKCQKCNVSVELTLPCEHKKRLPCHTDEATYLCDVMVDDVSPFCKHNVKRKCHQKAEDVQCPQSCEDRLDCGHACTRNCHKNDDPEHINFKCRKPCEQLNKNCTQAHVCQKMCFEECGDCIIKVKIKLSCGHETTPISCSTDASKLKCYKKCEKHCDECKNRCKKKCWEDCKPCKILVKKEIPECRHQTNVECSVPPTRERCNAKCERLAPCGHPCKSMCRKPCGTEKCMEIVKLESSYRPAVCGHRFIYAFCYQRHEVPYNEPKKYLAQCREPCDELLECGDPCGGTCGECWQGRLHRTCNKKCGATLICGHICTSPCRQLCPPCTEPCSFVCKHSRCPKKCGVPCVLCKEKCEWKCEHYACTRKCGDPCNRPPCMAPCPLKIEKCGHDCIGFCGEPCPPVCRECNPEVKDIMFGYEDEPDARFVLLEDCEHVIESQALDQHLSTAPEGGEIVMKVCPLCKTPIKKTLRYMNYVKQTYRHIMNVKRQIFGDSKQIKNKTQNLNWKLQKLQASDLDFFSEVPTLSSFLRDCYEKVSLNSAKRPLSDLQLSTITFYHEILETIVSRKEEFAEGNEFAGEVFDFLKQLLERLHQTKYCVNRQLIMNFSNELRRYCLMVDYCKVLEEEAFACYKREAAVKQMSVDIRGILLGHTAFTDDEEVNLKRLFKNLQTALRVDRPLTSEEKEMINLAMSRTFGGNLRGHWYHCPNGHYYCITECGMARQAARCPTCQAAIGQNANYQNYRRAAFQ